MTAIEAIRSSRNVAITAHRTPDGDAIGAAFALGMTLKNMGKVVYVILEGYNERFNIIPGSGLLYADEPDKLEPDTLIALDCGSKERLGAAEVLLTKSVCTVNIDHHLSNTDFAQINYVDTQASSTCEIVFRILREMNALDKDIASALYAGIIYDTGGLRHNSTSAATLDAVKVLMAYDIPFSQIYNELMRAHTLAEARAMGRAMENLRLYESGTIACTYITREDLRDTGATIADLGDICEFALNISGVNLAVFIYQRLDGKGCKVSFRSRNTPIDGIARQFGGGGHSLAAGCDFGGTLEQARETMLGMLGTLL